MEFTLTVDGINGFAGKLRRAAGGLKGELKDALEVLGIDLLELVAGELMADGSVDTGRLLNSFSRGGMDSVFACGGLELTVGTCVEYAGWVNNGHLQNSRFVPGYFDGESFTYDASAGAGIVLSETWVEGTHYWDDALSAFEQIFPGKLEELWKSTLERMLY